MNLKIETPDKQNATFAAALRVPMSDTDPDYPAMVLANYMFGGSITARMPDRIRNREGLSYGVNSNFAAPQPAVGNAARFGGSGHQQSEELAESGGEFSGRTGEDAGRRIHGGGSWRPRRRRSGTTRTVGRSQDQALLRLIATREDDDRTLAWDEQMDAKLEALTLDQVNAAFRRHVDASAISIVKAGDFKAADVYQQ